MKVGLLTTSYPRFKGDYRGVFIRGLVDALRREGEDVTVVEPRGYSALKQGSGLVPNLKSSWLARLQFPFYCVHFLVIAVFHGTRCELLHANWSLSGFFAVVAGKLTRTPVIVTERGQFLIDARNTWVNRWLRWVLASASVRVVISETARDTLVRKFADLSFHVIPNGVDDEKFSPVRRAQARSTLGMADGVTHILTAGRLTSVKKLDTLVAASAELSRRGSAFRVWVVGDGEERESLGRAVTAAGLDPHVSFVGAVSPDEVALWMCGADVYVLCSEGEGGGNVVLEAMSAGVAVVSTPVGWARDFITNGENGILYAVGDAEALAHELLRVIEDPGLGRGLGAAARRTIEEGRLNWSGCAERYVEQYRRIVD